MTDHGMTLGLPEAVQRYFNLMYEADLSGFDQVFRETAQLHGFREGQMAVWPAATYKDVLANRPSPKSLGAPRQEEILLMDFASPTQAMVKVRVRINQVVFVDYLSYHWIDGQWLITAKSYHVDQIHG
jgi:hypothetical protein